MSRLPKQDWVDEDAVRDLNTPDPLRAVFARNRAKRRGDEAPLTMPEPSPPVPATDAVAVPLPPLKTDPMSNVAALFIAANAELSGAAIKVLLTALAYGQDTPISLSQMAQASRLSKNTVIAGIRECLDWGWLTRRQSCPRCGDPLPLTDGEKVSICAHCARPVAPQSRYTLQNPHRTVHKSDSPVQNLNRAVEYINSPVQILDRFPVQEMNSPLQIVDSPVRFLNAGETVQDDTYPVQKSNRVKDRINDILSRHTDTQDAQPHYPVQKSNSTPMQKSDSPVQKSNSPHVRADSESVARIRDSDSRIPPTSGSGETGRIVYASGEWQQITEKLAKDSAKRVGDKSVGFHIKVWAHARKVDWEKGGRWFEEGLLAIAQELEGKHNTTGKSQGALWTKMVRRYFEEKGSPLLTEAEAEEWKELHGSYTPPTL